MEQVCNFSVSFVEKCTKYFTMNNGTEMKHMCRNKSKTNWNFYIRGFHLEEINFENTSVTRTKFRFQSIGKVPSDLSIHLCIGNMPQVLVETCHTCIYEIEEVSPECRPRFWAIIVKSKFRQLHVYRWNFRTMFSFFIN